MSTNDIVGGVLNRFLVIDGQRREPKPFVTNPDPRRLQSLGSRIKAIRDRYVEQPENLDFSADAREMWGEFYTAWMNKRANMDPRHADLTARTFMHVMKISMVYAALAAESKISARSLAVAIEIGRWLELAAWNLFRHVGQDRSTRAADLILEKLKKAKGVPLLRRQVQRSLAGRVTGEDFKGAIRTLTENNQIREYRIPSGAGQEMKYLELCAD